MVRSYEIIKESVAAAIVKPAATKATATARHQTGDDGRWQASPRPLKRLSVALHMIDLGDDVNSNGMSKLVFTILSPVAEAERGRTRERIGEVKANQTKHGRYLGGNVPFGFSKGENGALTEVEAEQIAIREIVALKSDGRGGRNLIPDLIFLRNGTPPGRLEVVDLEVCDRLLFRPCLKRLQP